jgi:heptosyltransferase III
LGLDGVDGFIFNETMKILVICLQRIGDVLLTTPLIRSIKSAYPHATVDALVCNDTMQVLEGNADINAVIVTHRHSKKIQRLKELFNLWNTYDISVSTIPSDRARLYGWAASTRHFGTHLEKDGFLAKKLMLSRVLFDNINTHTVAMNLKICDLMGIPKIQTVVAPTVLQTEILMSLKAPYVVVHPYPKFVYKSWKSNEWKKLLAQLIQKGLHVYISGSNDPQEFKYCQDLVISDNVTNISGKYSLAELSVIISNASLFIGVDTSVTHIAAATGVKVIAIYGPTNPVKWGPWPVETNYSDKAIWLGHAKAPQVHQKITLIQGSQSCIPCAQEGCHRHINSESECLTTLTSEKVEKEVDRVLVSSEFSNSLEQH